MDVFNQLKSDNELSSEQLDATVNSAFYTLCSQYRQFELICNEGGVTIINFASCTDEETGGFGQRDVENNLTNELLRIASIQIIQPTTPCKTNKPASATI